MKDPYDRHVHVNLPGGGQLVRYERAGKWYVEYPKDPSKKRRHLKMTVAVELAVEAETLRPGSVRLNQPGGLAFESAFRRAFAAKHTKP